MRADAQTTFSAKVDGGRVFKVDGQDDQRFTLLIVYPHPVTVMYQFTLDEGGAGQSFGHRSRTDYSG